jgi:hypothetical protein
MQQCIVFQFIIKISLGELEQACPAWLFYTIEVSNCIMCECQIDETVFCECCNKKYCWKCKNDVCDWCYHMKTEQVSCPDCSTSVEIFNQTVCAECISFHVRDDKEFLYCSTCNEFQFDSQDCLGHDVITDRVELVQKVQELFPALIPYLKIYA